MIEEDSGFLGEGGGEREMVMVKDQVGSGNRIWTQQDGHVKGCSEIAVNRVGSDNDNRVRV